LCTPEKTSQSVTHPEIAPGQARLTPEFFAGVLPKKKVYLGGMSILSILLSLESGCHTIPIHIKPYRYAPILKEKIEKQIAEMLFACLIKQSTNPFSSPVLLVKKKDKSYRFCVDYRHLNAITIKGQYHVPIIEDLLDELKHTSWFSTLNLCDGFHQIPMDSTDCLKNAFQTHLGHYEFRVMSFGLTSAPHSFQKAMNSILAPFQEICFGFL
jgi:hypothetical protein